ncbi:MAG: hypothetical protein PVJ72_19345 [Gammaproteobacteria bacterium]|jgi:hypothetical protein
MRVFGKGNIMAAWKKQLIGNIQVFIVIKKKELLTLLRKPQKHSKEITMVNEHKNVGVPNVTPTDRLEIPSNVNKQVVSCLWIYIIVLSVVSILSSARVYAEGYYELIEGNGVEVCEVYEKNLNSFKPKVPMTCGRKVNKDIEGLDKPHWTRPDAVITPSGKALYAFYSMFGELLWERDANPVYYYLVTKWPEWQGNPEQMKQARQQYDVDRQARSGLKPILSEFDIDNDGKIEPVYFEKPCGSVYGSLLAVLTPDYKGIDRMKTELVMPHPPLNRKGSEVFRPLFPGERSNPIYEKYGYRPNEDSIHNVHYDVFFTRVRLILISGGAPTKISKENRISKPAVCAFIKLIQRAQHKYAVIVSS